MYVDFKVLCSFVDTCYIIIIAYGNFLHAYNLYALFIISTGLLKSAPINPVPARVESHHDGLLTSSTAIY